MGVFMPSHFENLHTSCYDNYMTKPVRQLTTLFTPDSYKIDLDVSARVARTFRGTVTITGSLLHSGKEIVLHSKDLEITKGRIDNQDITWKYGENDELILNAKSELPAGKHTVVVSFDGKITEPMHGIYPCYFKDGGKDKELLATQLESHYAREVFPCVDEPAGKATFDVTLTTEKGITVLGNMPAKSSQEKSGVLITSFETTPKMSPYLFAFVAGELVYTETTNKNGVLIRAWAVPGKKDHTKFSLDYAAKTLEFYDDYFQEPYPLAKCDIVAVPDFAAGAMENWGLITFRESCMLIDEANTPPSLKEYVAGVVTHELAHQWFGNLVTMKWWDDLWLNESFANWMENHSVDNLDPQWKVWDQWVASSQQYSFNRDSLANVQAVRTPVTHPEQLNSLFDPAIVYAKGGGLLRMLQQFLGNETFRDGLRVYMKRHKYQNAEADDLWDALSEVSGKDIKSFMGKWLTQPGHPVVAAKLEGNTLHLSQERFYADPTVTNKTGAIWPLPLLSDQITEELLETEHTTVTPTAKPVLINKNHTGFYHVQYDAEMLADIANLVATHKLSSIDRQALLVDGLALARAGLQPTIDVVKLLASYKDEAEYSVWQSMASVVGALRTLINHDPVMKPQLQKYTAALAQKQFQRLGWERIEGESYFDELLRVTVLGHMAYAEVPAVVDRALAMFNAASKPEDIRPPDLRAIVYGLAVHELGAPAFDKLLGWYKETQSADERINIVAGLSDIKDAKLAEQATALFTTKTIKQQDIAYWFIYFMRNHHARPVVWQWMKDNWDWIIKQFKNSHDYADFPKYSASAFSTREELAMYTEFFEPKLKENDIAMVIRQGIEEITIRALWRERDLPAIAEFLAQNVKSN